MTGASTVRPRHRSVQPRALVIGGVLIGFAALACLVFWPTSPLDSTHLPGGGVGDPDELTWFLSYTPWALLHGHNPLLTHAIDAPGGVNLANNTSMPFLGLLGSPVTLALGPIAAYNVLLRLALFSSAAACYLVARRYCSGEVGPAFAGLVYGFGPAIVSHLGLYGHLDLVFVPFPPLLLACLDELLARRWRSPRRLGALIGLLAAAQYLTSAELFADVALLGVLGVGVFCIAERRQIRAISAAARSAVGPAIGVFALLAGYPIYLALAGPGHVSGPVQAASHLQRFRTDLLETIVPYINQWFDPASLKSLARTILAPVRNAGGSAELGGYLGLPLLILCIGTLVGCRRSGSVRLFVGLGAAALLASLGGRLQVDGHTTTISLPEAVFAHLPLLENTVPARYALFVALFAALVAAIGVDRAIDRLKCHHWRSPEALVALLVGAASIATLAPALPVSAETTALPSATAQAIARLVPAGSRVLTYPYPTSPYALAMLWQASDNFSFDLLGGYATVATSSGNGQIYPLLETPAYLQELLSYGEAGRHSHYPVPESVSDPSATVCETLAADHVGAVLTEPYGRDYSAVAAILQKALGSPLESTSGLSLWRVDSSDCTKS